MSDSFDVRGKLSGETIQHLKKLIEQKEGRLSRERLPSSQLLCGIPKGAIVEVSGNAQVDWVLSFFKENPSLKILWLENSFTLFPPALHQRGVDLNRFVFGEVGEAEKGRSKETKKHLFTNIRKALRSHAFDCVVSPNQFQEERVLKALQLLTERSQAILFLLTDQLHSSWPILLQFEVDRCPLTHQFAFKIKKDKGWSIPPEAVLGGTGAQCPV